LEASQANSLRDPVLKELITEKGLVEWFKAKALNSNPSTAKKKKKKTRYCENMKSDCRKL
jgi:hypothetical protein